jgi:hypothetical protein
LLTFYEGQGLKKPIRYRLCTGTVGDPHAPILMEPSDEDLYEGPGVLKCTCEGVTNPPLRRDCPHCCEKCHECLTHRKFILPFDYLPFRPRIADMCRSRSTCFEFLEVWREHESWLGRPVSFRPPFISQFWHGQKMREIQRFWDPNNHWELPVQCPTPNCRRVYRAFPTPCIELERAWEPNLGRYQFICECDTYIDVVPSIVQVSPIN